MVRTHKKTFQYYEVTCSGEFWNERYPPRRFLRRGKEALSRALGYARQVSAESAAVTTVHAVYRLGATGQSTTPVAGFQRGHETFATYHPPLAALPPAAGKAGGVKKHERTGNGRIIKDPLDVPLSWKKDVLAYAYEQIERKHPDESRDPAVRSIVARRLDRLVQVLRFYKKNSDFVQPIVREQGPYAIEDAAALVLFRKNAAYKLAKRLLGTHIADNHFHPDDPSYVNMDWFNFEF